MPFLTVTQLLLNGLHLLIQIVLALTALHLLLDPATDALLDLQQIDFGIIFRTEIKDTKVAPGVVGSPHDLRDHEVLEPAAEAAGPWHEIDRQRACEGPGDTRVEPSELRGLPLPLTDRGTPGLEHESQQRVLEDFEV